MIDLSANPFCALLGIPIPVVQAPTASIAGPELAAAVSIAGGLGSMGLTWTPEGEAVRAVREVRAATDQPFAVNFALAFDPDSLPAVLEAGPPVVTFSWGEVAPFAARVHAAGARLGVQVGNCEGAKRALDAGADFLICQGVEAGGHVQSSTSLRGLLDSVLAVAGNVPVIAAGGIADGTGIATALRAGAHGAMLGTRFVATQESRAHAEYKRLLVESGVGDTALTLCFDGGWPNALHRVLRNSTLDQWESAGCPQPGRRPGEGEAIAHLASGDPIVRYEDTAPRAGIDGDIGAMALYAGEGIAQIDNLPAAGDLLRRLWAEALAALQATS